MKLNFKISVAFVVGLLFSITLLAQNRPPNDSTSRGPGMQQGQRGPGGGSGPRPYNEVITGRTRTDDGLFKVHKQEETYLFEIPDSLLGQDILVVNRISKAAAGTRVQMLGYGGDLIGENVVRFEKGPGNKIFLKSISYQERSTDTTADGLYRSFTNSNMQPIVASFDIRAFARDSVTGARGSVIDVTSFLNSDNDILYFEQNSKRTLSLGQQQNDRSYVDGIKSFDRNLEIRAVKTYTRSAAQGGQGQGGFGGQGGASGPITYELNSSFVLLPKKPMQPRYFDARVGYFATGYTDFDANPQGVKRLTVINRWRLEPKPEDVQKYLRGELVEPAKQIVYYIDPATPKKWIPYLIQGVNDWNAAFEKAGWKNAIVAKEAPRNDPSWSLEGAGYSAIVYKPSDIPNASGPHIHDPRTGEILETHINWYHNIMNLVRNWYIIQTAMVDKRARTMKFDDELMGQLIRFVSSHEVGHTLGLRHNYGSSSTVPVEKLRDKAWVEANGHTPSIMDYARFNYVAQPEDNIDAKGLFPRIGDYDKWAIEWGYRWFPDLKSADAEKAKLNKWVIEKLSGNKRLWFGTETDPNDPRAQNEDLGDNAMLASGYGIKNLKRILPNILEWTKEDNEGYGNARTVYNELVGQFNRYMGHVAKNIGGITTTPRTVEEKGAIYEYVPKATQKEAMQFLQQQLFTTPKWLLDKQLFSVAAVGDANTIAGVQQSVLNRIISTNTLDKLTQAEAFDAAKAYPALEFLGDLRKGVWTELGTGSAIDIYRRNLQRIYAERLISIIRPPQTQAPTGGQQGGGQQGGQGSANRVSDAVSLVKGHAKSLAAQIKTSLPGVKDNMTRFHLQDIYDRLTDALKTNNND